MSNDKRTRSQSTLSDLFTRSLQLQRSPLMDVPSAVRNIDAASIVYQENDPMSSSSRKRLSSPSSSDTAQSSERELKRSKTNDIENEISQPSRIDPTWKLVSPKKPVSSNPQLVFSSAFKSSSPSRAKSVPPLDSQMSTPVPHLDLRQIPPSPWRSPSKEPPKLRVMSMPPSSPTTEDASDNDKTPTQFNRFDKAKHNPGPFQKTSSSRLGPFDFHKIPVATKTPAQKLHLGINSPLSPLTPLPSTPLYQPTPIRPGSLLRQAFEPPIGNVVSRLSSPASTLSNSSTVIPPTSTPSLLPRPQKAPLSRPPSTSVESSSSKSLVPPTVSTILPSESPSSTSSSPLTSLASFEGDTNESHAPTISTSTLVSREKPPTASKPPSSGAARTKSTKSSKRPTPVPLGGRMTRSVTLRMKKRDEGTTPAKPHNTLSTPASTSAAPKSRTSTPVKSAMKNAQGRPSITSTSVLSNRSTTTTTTVTTVARKRFNTPSGNLPRTIALPAQTSRSFIKSPSSVSEVFGPRPASLSNLSIALEKLALPPPSRPNTSMGFNVGTDDETVKSVPPNKDKGKQKANSTMYDGTVKGKAVGAKQTGKTGRKEMSITSFFSPVVAGSSSSSSIPPPSSAVVTSSSALKANHNSEGATLKRPSSIFVPPRMKLGTGAPAVSGFRSGFTAGGMNGRGGATASRSLRNAGGIVGNKVFNKVSKKSTLAVVEASPVKGGAPQDASDNIEVVEPLAGPSNSTEVQEKEKPLERTFDLKRILADAGEPYEPIESDGDGADVRGKSHDDAWKKNASCRASLALQSLSQSLSSLPKTPPRVKGSMGPPPVPGRYPGLRSASSSYPSSSSGTKAVETAPAALGKGTGAHVSRGRGEGGSSGKKASVALKVLKQCTIFVDVRTDVGDDAGSLFVDMLRGLGAKILARIGQSCTHIVYKDGLTSTLSRYRQMNPKPLVVGISWVVECAEQRAKVDETKFLVDLESVNVAGIIKRRRSMLPKHIAIIPDDSLTPVYSPTGESSASFDMSVDSESGNQSIEKSLLIDTDDDNLPPLEKARRRRSMLAKT